jgi:flagellar hook-length control protein FliK
VAATQPVVASASAAATIEPAEATSLPATDIDPHATARARMQPPPVDTATQPALDAPKSRADAPQTAASLLAALGAPADLDKATSAKPQNDHASLVAPLVAVAAAHPMPAAATHVETVAAPAFTPGWQDETVAKLAHIVVTRNERAELKLNPAELGPVSVRVDMNADHASLTIVAASPETRSALEQSLPQLRDLLASQGITLGQASVHDGSAQRDPSPQAWVGAPQNARDTSGSSVPAAETVQRILRRADRLVDVFA